MTYLRVRGFDKGKSRERDNISLFVWGVPEICGPGSVVYSDWLRAGRCGDRIPVWTRFSAPVQTGPGAHPASSTVGTGSFPGGGGKKRPERDADPSPPSSAMVKKG